MLLAWKQLLAKQVVICKNSPGTQVNFQAQIASNTFSILQLQDEAVSQKININ